MATALVHSFTQGPGLALVAAIHLGGLDGEAAQLQGFSLGTGERLIPRPWPEAPLELELWPAQAPGTLKAKAFENPDAFARAWAGLLRLHVELDPGGAEVLSGPGPGLGGAVLRRVLQPVGPFLLVWSVGPVRGRLQSLEALEHGPSSLRVAFRSVPVPVGGMA